MYQYTVYNGFETLQSSRVFKSDREARSDFHSCFSRNEAAIVIDLLRDKVVWEKLEGDYKFHRCPA